MKLIKISLIFLIACGFGISRDGFGKGLSVSPSSYVWDSAKVGALTRFPAGIHITNKSEYAKSYVLRVMRKGEIQKPAHDCQYIPSRKWISFERKQVTIGPGEWAEPYQEWISWRL